MTVVVGGAARGRLREVPQDHHFGLAAARPSPGVQFSDSVDPSGRDRLTDTSGLARVLVAVLA